MRPDTPRRAILKPAIEEQPTQEDLKRRAETLAAAVGVSIDDGDDATKLAATIALLLAELDSADD